MCIRDRPRALAHLQRGNIAPVDLAQASIGPGMAVYTRYDNCLLYTSDAADERSSVDLGGRRIIKKKKP